MSNLSTEATAARRLAAARAAGPAVDHNGRPKGKPVTYTYDEAGRLVAAETLADE